MCILMRRNEETNGIRRIVTRNKRGRNYGRQMVGVGIVIIYTYTGWPDTTSLFGGYVYVWARDSQRAFSMGPLTSSYAKESWFVEEYTTFIIIIFILNLHKIFPCVIFRFLFPGCEDFIFMLQPSSSLKFYQGIVI